MRVVLTNVYGDGNKGGAAITIALISQIRRLVPDAEVTLIPVSGGVSVDKAFRFTLRAHPDVRFAAQRKIRSGPLAGARHGFGLLINVLSRGRLFRSDASQAIRSADVVIGKGGQAFRGSTTRRFRHVLALGGTLHPLALAIRCGRRTAVHGVTIGPFSYTEPSWVLARWVLRRLDRVEVRTSASVSECVRLGVDTSRVELSPDIVFSWPDLGLWSPQPDGGLLPDGPRRLAVTIQAQDGHRDDVVVDWYEQVIRAVVDAGMADEAVILRHSGGPKESDSVLAARLAERLSAHMPARFDDSDLSPAELLDLYAGSVGVIGGRVHSAVFGLVSGSLAFPVDPQILPKARDIFHEVGASDLVLRLPLRGRTAEASSRAAADTVIAALWNRDERLATLASTIASAAGQVEASIATILFDGDDRR